MILKCLRSSCRQGTTWSSLNTVIIFSSRFKTSSHHCGVTLLKEGKSLIYDEYDTLPMPKLENITLG